MSSIPEDEKTGADRRRALERVLADKFGLRLDGYGEAAIRMALAELPSPLPVDGPDLAAHLLATFSVGETSFLRHQEQFRALEAALPTLPAMRQGRSVRAWSAGCASGEEAYSLAAVLRDFGIANEVIGTDVNPGSIARAREGKYRLWSLRGVDIEQTRHFLDLGPLEVVVHESLRHSASFEVQNLVHDAYPSQLDVIFCRNVLLYFHPDAAARVYRRLADALTLGGVLFIGYADPTPELPSLEPLLVEDVRIYRRVDPHAARGSLQGRSPPALPLPARSAQPAAAELDVLSLVRGLAAQRDFERALQWLASMCRASEVSLSVEAHVLTAMIADEAGNAELALEAARRAYFLAPEEPITLYLVGSALERTGAAELGGKRLRQALFALGQCQDGSRTLPYGEGLTGNQLRRMIDARRR